MATQIRQPLLLIFALIIIGNASAEFGRCPTYNVDANFQYSKLMGDWYAGPQFGILPLPPCHTLNIQSGSTPEELIINQTILFVPTLLMSITWKSNTAEDNIVGKMNWQQSEYEIPVANPPVLKVTVVKATQNYVGMMFCSEFNFFHMKELSFFTKDAVTSNSTVTEIINFATTILPERTQNYTYQPCEYPQGPSANRGIDILNIFQKIMSFIPNGENATMPT